MPIPIRSSDSNISRACCLVKDILSPHRSSYSRCFLGPVGPEKFTRMRDWALEAELRFPPRSGKKAGVLPGREGRDSSGCYRQGRSELRIAADSAAEPTPRR